MSAAGQPVRLAVVLLLQLLLFCQLHPAAASKGWPVRCSVKQFKSLLFSQSCCCRPCCSTKLLTALIN